jgi:ferredoxin
MSWVGLGATADVTSQAGTGPDTGQPRATVRVPHLPRERKRLLALLGDVDPWPGELDASSLPIAEVQVDADHCSACGLCAKFCPTGALKFYTDEEVFALGLSVAACIDCGVCALTCPESAISYGDQLPGGELLAERAKRLVAGALQPCVGCGSLTAHMRGRSECYVCHQRPQSAYLLDDLSRQRQESETRSGRQHGQPH